MYHTGNKTVPGGECEGEGGCNQIHKLSSSATSTKRENTKFRMNYGGVLVTNVMQEEEREEEGNVGD